MSRDLPPGTGEFLAEYGPEVSAIFLKARERVLEMMPNTIEKFYPGYKMLIYSLNEQRTSEFCYLGPQRAWVNMGFIKGTSLTNTDKLLEGSGKTLRHIKLKSLADIERPGLRTLFMQALELEQAENYSQLHKP